MPAAQTGVSLVHIKYHVFLFPSPALVLFWIFCLQHLILPLALRRELGAQLDPLSLFSLWYCDSQSLGSSLLHSFIFYLPSFAFFSLLITPYPSPSNWNYNLRCTLRRSFFFLSFGKQEPKEMLYIASTKNRNREWISGEEVAQKRPRKLSRD